MKRFQNSTYFNNKYTQYYKSKIAPMIFTITCFIVINIGLSVFVGCSSKTEHEKLMEEKNPYKDWDSEQLSEMYFTDSLKKARFDNGNYKATFYSNNGKQYLDLAIEIQCDFGNFDVKYASPENIKFSHNFDNLIKYNTNQLEFDNFDDMIYSFDRDRDDQVAIFKKTFEIDKEFGLYSHFKSCIKIDDLNNFPLILDYSEINIEYEIGDDKFYKKVVPKYKINTKQEIVNNYVLSPFYQCDKDGQVLLDIEITKKSEVFDVYFASSEKVFLNIYTWSENRPNYKSIKVFDSSHKMNFLTVIDDSLPIAKGESKIYQYKWDGKFNLDGNSKGDEVFDFEIGVKVSPKPDTIKLPLFLISQ